MALWWVNQIFLHIAVNAPLPFVNGNLHDDTEPGWEDKNKGILAASRA